MITQTQVSDARTLDLNAVLHEVPMNSPLSLTQVLDTIGSKIAANGKVADETDQFSKEKLPAVEAAPGVLRDGA